MNNLRKLIFVVLGVFGWCAFGHAQTTQSYVSCIVHTVGVCVGSGTAMDQTDLAAYPLIGVAGYHQPGDSGGGTFVQQSGACTPNGGSIVHDGASSAHCFVRINSTWSPKEFGAYEDCCGTGAHDDTTALQNWMNANQPHVAVPGNSKISSPLTCNDGGIIQGSPTQSVGQEKTIVPTFEITADPTSFSGSAMLIMAPNARCAIHGVGLIGDGTSGAYDIVDVNGGSALIDGHSYLFGGKNNVRSVSGGINLEIYDSAFNNSTADNLYINSSNAKVMRNAISSAGGNNITFKGTEIAIENNNIQYAGGWGIAAQGARQFRIVGNYLDNSGLSTPNTSAIQIKNSANLAITGNTFHRTGAATQGSGSPTSHIFFDGADDSVSLSGNVYFPGTTGDATALPIRPDYDYDASPTAALTNIAIADNPAPQNVGVFSPNALPLLGSSVSPHVPSGYLSGLVLSNHTGSTSQIDIATGEASDSTATTVLRNPSGCTVDLTHQGLGGVDVLPSGGGVLPSQTYYFFVVSACSGANPGGNPPCIASTSLTPSFANVSSYTISQTGMLTQGSPIVFNAGGPFPGGAATNLNANPLAGMAFGDLITGAGVPSGTTISSPTSFYKIYTATTANGSALVTNFMPALSNQVAVNMTVGGTNIPTTPGGVIIAAVCTTQGQCGNAGNCSSPPCIALSQNATGNNLPNSVTISGNFTITLSANATSTSGTSGTPLTVYDGYYRMVGALYTDSMSRLVEFHQTGDSFYLNTPGADIANAGLNGTAGSLHLASVPNGISVEAFGRCVTNSYATAQDILLFTPSASPGTPVGFPSVPGYSLQTSTGTPSFSYRLQTDTSSNIEDIASTVLPNILSCMTDGWVLKRSP